MLIVHSDQVFPVPPDTSPNYNRGNSLLKLMNILEQTQFAAELESYLFPSIQYLYPYQSLELYGPSGSDWQTLDPAQQDNKHDFQKQNVKDFVLADTHLVRGWVQVDKDVIPFLKISYAGDPETELARLAGGTLGDLIQMWIRVGTTATQELVALPYNEANDRYEVELWGLGKVHPKAVLDVKGQESLARGLIVVRPDLISGTKSDFDRSRLEEIRKSSGELDMRVVSPQNAMHPLLPLHIELAFTNSSASVWDSKASRNYHYEFNMILRGWENFLEVGNSLNPHGGVGTLEYRNLLSNYFKYTGSCELGRRLEPWNFNAFGPKESGNAWENFLTVDYMDLHILKPDSGIGLHRHRDNQEIFMILDGEGYMVVGDWCKLPQRERSFEIRTLRAGHFAMLKGGHLHGLMNPSDANISLFMFGGYD